MNMQLDEFEAWIAYFCDFRKRVRFIRVRSFLHRVPWAGTPHTYGWYAILFVESGNMTITVAGEARLLTAGSLVIVPPGNEFHLQNLAPDTHCLNHRVYLNTLDHEGDQILHEPVIADGCHSLIHPIRQAYLTDNSRGPHWQQRMRALMLDVFIGALEGRKEGQQSIRRLSQAEQAVVLAFIDTHLGEELRAPALAAELKLSHAYFTKVFRNTYGVAPRTFILTRRLERASVLLKETDTPITLIIEDLGFGNEGFFYRSFKQRYGMTPREYRHSETDHYFTEYGVSTKPRK